MKLPGIRDIENLSGKRVLLRAGLNVPLDHGVVRDDFRLKRALPTINFLRESGAKILVIGHIGRSTDETLKPVYDHLSKYFPLTFVPDVIGEHAQRATRDAADGSVVLFENLRQHEEEKINDQGFTQHLASLAEVYVNDAFASAHRRHSSIVGIPNFLPGYAGISFEQEISELSKALDPERLSIAILGGAKFETKIPLIRKFLDVYDYVAVSGALANEFFKARNLEIGQSKISDETLSLADLLNHKRLLLPADVTVMHSSGMVMVKRPEEVTPTEVILDVGPKTISELEKIITDAKFVLWNGPLGYYEKGFGRLTKQLAQIISSSDAYSIVGGGDTIAAIAADNIEDMFSFVSTAGGAMLEFLLEGTLPGIDVLRK